MPQTQEEYEQELENKEDSTSQDDPAEYHDVLNDSIHYQREKTKTPSNDNQVENRNPEVKPDGDEQEMVTTENLKLSNKNV